MGTGVLSRGHGQAMALILETRWADGSTSRLPLQAGRNRAPVDASSTYRIFDDQTGLSPGSMSVRRVDSDLVIDGLGPTGTQAGITVEFPEYYNLCSTSSSCEVVIESGGGTAPVKITAATEPIGALSDGSFVLYDPGFVPSTLAGLGEAIPVRPILYGLGGLAVAGLAIGGGGVVAAVAAT